MRSRNLSLHCAFTFFSLVLGLGSTFVLPAQTGTSEQLPAPAGSSSAANSICPSCIRATVEFLASDALRGRGSRTRDELLAATYLASLLRAYQVDPAGDAGGFIQQVRIPSAKLTRKTWNVVGVLRGTDPALRDDSIVLSAHLDHLGVGAAVNGDAIYNGADDDASGVAAVLELARILGKALPPKRTVYFVFFGSEEVGMLGSTYFSRHPPTPLANIAAMIEFEMIGRRDPALANDNLWLSGWERSNLGPALADHGAALVPDPHTAQKFFSRSDNYVFAKKGVVAQTASSFGLHSDYHRPSDDLAHMDFEHVDEAIASMIKAIEWLANSDFKPEWKPGQNPQSEAPRKIVASD